MRVSIKHNEIQQGLIFKKTRYCIEASVVFEDWELAQIKKLDFWDYPLVWLGDHERCDLTVRQAIKGGGIFSSLELGDVNIWERSLKEQLVDLKEALSGAASRDPNKSESFEL